MNVNWWYKRKLSQELKSHWQIEKEKRAAWDWHWAMKATEDEASEKVSHNQEEEDSDYDYYYEDVYDEDFEDEIREIEAERNCSWGEPFDLHYFDPILGRTSLGMLEGEWLQTFRQWRKHKTHPEEFIAELERMFNEARDEFYLRYDYSDIDDDDDYCEICGALGYCEHREDE